MPLGVRVFSLLSTIFARAFQALALRLLPESSQEVNERTQAILKNCNADSTWTSYENALIQAEDHRFYLHEGVDYIAIIRAVYQTSVQRCRQGGSTIEQQLVRTLTRDYRPSYSRKIRELLLASTFSQNFSIHEVLHAYLSVAYFGTGMVGLKQAIEKISIPAAISGHPESYLIAHLRYPMPEEADDRLHRQRLKRAEVTSYYCESASPHPHRLTRYKSRRLSLLAIRPSNSNHRT